MVVILLTALLLSTGLVPEKADSTVYQQSVRQADQYFTQLEKGRSPSLHYWGLLQLAQTNDSLETHIRTRFQQSDLDKSYKRSFLSPRIPESWEGRLNLYQRRIASAALQTHSASLALELLLAIEDESVAGQIFSYLETNDPSALTGKSYDFSPLFQAIRGDTKIEPDEFPVDNLEFPHFILLFRADDRFSPQYFKEAYRHWESFIDQKKYSIPGNLSESVHLAALLRIGYESKNMGAIVSLHSTVMQDQTFPNTSFKLDLYQILDVGAYRLGHYEKPLKLHEKKTIPLALFLGDRYREYFFRKHRGIFLYQLGNIKKAQVVYQQVLEGINQYNIPMSKIDILNNLGITYYKTGYYDQYVDYLSQALTLARDKDNYRYQLEIYRNLHIYHRKNKNWATAREYLTQSQELAKKHGKTKDLAAVYVTTATYFRDFNTDYEKATEFLKRTEKLVGPDKYYNEYVKLVSEKAKLHLAQNKLNEAQRHLNQLRATTKEKSDTPNYLFSLIHLAAIDLQLKNYGEVEKQIQKIHQYDNDILDFQLVVKLQSIEAQLAAHKRDIDQAISIIQPAIEQIIQRAQNSSDIRTGYWHVEPEYIDVLKTGVDLLLSDGRKREAVKLLDRIKTINDAELYKNPLVKAEQMTDEELSQEQRLNERLNGLRKDYLNADGQKKLELKNQINTLKAQRNQLYGEISSIDQSGDFSIRRIQHDLPYSKLVMHFTELKDTFYIAYISSNDIQIDQIKLNNKLRTLFDSAIHSLVQQNTDLDKLHSLYTALRLHDIPSYIQSISVIPDSYLYRLPIGILPTTSPKHSYSYGSTKYLIEQFVVNYHTSLQEQNNQYPASRRHKTDFTGYGITQFSDRDRSLVPLPYADQEINNILDQLNRIENKQVFLNEKATASSFKQHASKSRIIHLATHSAVNNREPLFSSIYFHQSANKSTSDGQGRIFAYELFEMDLSNQLIMMNSCESGSGPYLQGSGVMGLSRSLKYAGGRSLILNLWSVNDKYAADFATQLYHHLNHGDSKAEAMRKAKIYFLQQSNANPHYWGPYMLLGDPSPIVRNKGFSFLSFFMLGGITVMFLMGVGLAYRQRSEKP